MKWLQAILLMVYAATWPAPLLAATADAPSAPQHEQVLMLPGEAGGLTLQPVLLQVTLLLPNGSGPFPLAVMNHGANGSFHPENEPRNLGGFVARYFLSRGYAVALPMMRGYAGSQGRVHSHGCDLVATGMANAADIAAVIKDLARRPEIDTSRVVVAGQSFGGWNALFVGALHPPGVRALINFAGTVLLSTCAKPDTALVASAAALGSHATAPSIWFYGDNDSLISTVTWHAMHARYTAAGGRAELVPVGTFMNDSHLLIAHAEGLSLWVPKVDEFLARAGLPARVVNQAYLPMPFPPVPRTTVAATPRVVPSLFDHQRVIHQNLLENLGTQ
jgi:dienelactone hydrolase